MGKKSARESGARNLLFEIAALCRLEGFDLEVLVAEAVESLRVEGEFTTRPKGAPVWAPAPEAEEEK